MGEKAEKQYDYLTLCIHYRIISLLLSTAVFLSGMWEKEIRSLTGWGIIFGMFLSCLIGNYLYVRAEKNKDAMGAVLGVELAAYGIFIYLSGGLSSPYLWYVLCCMMISLSGEFDGSTPLLAAIWCVACALVGQQDRNPVRLESNILVGVLCTFGNFYVLRRHVQSIREGREELRDLNACLVEENRRSEYALSRVADMYEGFALMAMTDSERVLGELATLIAASVSPEGCVLIRRNEEQMIREIIIRGMPEKQGEELVSRATSMSRSEGEVRVNGQRYQLFSVESGSGDGMLILGAPNAESIAAKESGLKELLRREREFYVRLCGIIFRGLDMQSQMEAYISAEEKNRIADEIHDTVIQKLFGLNCGLKELELFVEKEETKRGPHYSELYFSKRRRHSPCGNCGRRFTGAILPVAGSKVLREGLEAIWRKRNGSTLSVFRFRLRAVSKNSRRHRRQSFIAWPARQSTMPRGTEEQKKSGWRFARRKKVLSCA